MDISERQKQLLLAIVREFIDTADAVASMQLVNKYNLPVSSATIRSEMKHLSEAGYLRQLHTSSGRVPTTTGLRYFIDSMLDQMEEIELVQQERIKRQIFQQRFATSDFIKQIMEALTGLTGVASYVIYDGNVYHYGLPQLLEMPEFGDDINQFKVILLLLEDAQMLQRVLTRNRSDRRLKIMIGSESGIKNLVNFATIYAPIKMHGGSPGIVGTIGPARIDYRRVIPAVNYITQVIDRAVMGWV